MRNDVIPIFPLNTVLFPGGYLSLRIFEPRYLRMLRLCAEQNTGFGIVLIMQGAEIGQPVKSHAFGTEARIVDFSQREDGTLGIAVEGERRFGRMLPPSIDDDGLQRCRVDWEPECDSGPIRPEYAVLPMLLQKILERSGGPHVSADKSCFDDPVWVAWRLAEILPITNLQRQQILTESLPDKRLSRLLQWIPMLETKDVSGQG